MTPDPDDMLDDYAHSLVVAQLERTRRAWARVRRAWGRYFGVLMGSPAEAHPDRKAALAERSRRYADREPSALLPRQLDDASE